jgi:hypothetical protein
MMNATRHTNKWDDGVRTHLDALKTESRRAVRSVRFIQSVNERPNAACVRCLAGVHEIVLGCDRLRLLDGK